MGPKRGQAAHDGCYGNVLETTLDKVVLTYSSLVFCYYNCRGVLLECALVLIIVVCLLVVFLRESARKTSEQRWRK